MARERRSLFAALAALALLLLGGRLAAEAYIDYQWYASLGAAALWRLKAENVLLLKGSSLLAGGAFVFANLYAARQSVASVVLPRRVGDLEIGEELSRGYLLIAVTAISLALAALLTLPTGDWTQLAAARLGRPFGESDPRFQADLGFWVYWLPFEEALYARALLVLAVVIAAVTFVYALTPSLRFERGALRVSGYARRHLSVLSAFVLLVLAWSYRLDAFRALIDGSGPNGLVSWVDHKVHVPASVALAIVAAVAAALVGVTGWAGQTRPAFAAATAVLVLALVLRQIAPAVAQRTLPRDAREENYVATRAEYTRRAFGVDRIASADSTLVFASATAAVHAVPLWDARMLARAVERTRGVGAVSGEVALAGTIDAPVEYVAERPAGGAGGTLERWTVVRVAGNAATPRGEVAGAAGSPLGDDDAATVLPALVFDSARGSLVLSDTAEQVAAIDVTSFGARLALALSEQNLRLARNRGEPARALLRRDVRERVSRIAPFFAQGAAVTPAVAGDTLYWIVHLYSASSTYPVSRPTGLGPDAWRYLRHSGVAIVHAFSGRVAIVPDPAPDPVARSWIDAVPGLFASWASIPAPVRRAVPPPVESGVAQAAAFAEFGPRGADAPPARTIRVPTSGAVGNAPAGVLLPPNDGTPSLSVPVVDGTGRVAGLVLVLGGAMPQTAWHPNQRAASDPSFDTILDQLRRTTTRAAAGRDVRDVGGAPRVLPVAGGVGYVVPRYLERGDAAPTLAGVAVSFGDRTATAPTAVAAVDALRDSSVVLTPPASEDSTVVRRARALYAAARGALRAGDWAAFGRAFDSLGVSLGRARP